MFSKKVREQIVDSMSATQRTPCRLLEADWLSDPLTVDVADAGDFGPAITGASVQRSRGCALEVRLSGKVEPLSYEPPPEEAKKGGQRTPRKHLRGRSRHEDDAHALEVEVVLSGLIESKTRMTGAGDLTVDAMAKALDVSVTHASPAPESWLVEWLINFDAVAGILPLRTERFAGSTFERVRGEQRLVLPVATPWRRQTSNDHFRIDVTLGGKMWKLTIGRPESGRCPTELKPGFVEFRGEAGLPNESVRETILVALSFALGRHLIPIGWTVFDAADRPTRAACREAEILGRDEMFSNPSMPPCPPVLRDAPAILDQVAVQRVVQCALDLGAQGIDLGFPLWLVWLAKASPLDASAAHYGAAMEALRSRFYATAAGGTTTLLVGADWGTVRTALDRTLTDAIAKLNPTPDEAAVCMLRNNLGGINNKSSGARYPEFFQLLDLPIDKVEQAALRERNKPAHGTEYDPAQYEALMATVQALHTLFNRIVLKLARCDLPYIDYSTYEHPVRALAEPLGGPNGDRQAAKV